jgi:MFS transporter, ACS family, D-galactonate transporter
LPNWQRWTTVWLLCLGMIIAYIDRSNLSVALASKDFIALFKLTDSDRGTLGSVFFWSYALLQIPAGMLVDRFGVKIPYAICFAIWCCVGAATGLVNTVAVLMGVRLLLGVFESLVTPASMRWIRYNVPEKSKGVAMGIFMAGSKYGPAAGAYLAAQFLVSHGWREMFVILGLGGLLWLIPWFLLVRNNDQELEAATTAGGAVKRMPFAEVMKKPAIWGILIGTFCYNYFVFFSMTWLPAYFAERRHLSLKDSGAYTSFSFGGMATVAILAGWAADKLIERGWNAIKVRRGFTIAGFVVASSEIIGAMSDSNDFALIMAIVSLSGLGLATANYWALTPTLLPGAAAGSIAGAQNMASNLAGAVAPLITGWLMTATGNYEAPMYAIWGFLLLGIAMYALLVREKFAR